MDHELREILGFWYIKNIDNNPTQEGLQNFINLVSSNPHDVLDFITFLRYSNASEYTFNLLKENNDIATLGETIRMLTSTINNVKQFLGEEFFEMQNSLIEELKIAYQNTELDPNVLAIISTMNIGGRN